MTPLGIASIDRPRSIVSGGRDPGEGMACDGRVRVDRRRRGHIQSIQHRQGSIAFLRRGSDRFNRMGLPPLLDLPPRCPSSSSLRDFPPRAPSSMSLIDLLPRSLSSIFLINLPHRCPSSSSLVDLAHPSPSSISLIDLPHRSPSPSSLLELPSSASDIQQRRALEICLIWLDRVVV
jgi:hypothetical protein